MSRELRYDIAERRLRFMGSQQAMPLDGADIALLNHLHQSVLDHFDVDIVSCSTLTLSERVNQRSNLGSLRNPQVRQSVILAAALSAVSVAISGRGALLNFPKSQVTKALTNKLKRANDRAAAQVMSEVLQLTTESLADGDEVLIESAITEGVRAKPGKEVGGNPTIPVGALFGKIEHRERYGMQIPGSVSLLSMGSDVVEGTTKSVTGQHSSLTALFVTEANVKRHLPDVYVQRWLAPAEFPRFNPRETSLQEAASIMATACGVASVDQLSAFFLDRPRHQPAMAALNEAGVVTPYDQDGDLLPGIILGLDCLRFPDSGPLHTMIGEIGGSAEWAVGVLPLVWRGGFALGMLTSHSSLSRKDLSPDELWRERFHFTEEEFIVIQDARFERKPYFTIDDIIDNPFAGGISAFGAITDNYYIPYLEGVVVDPERGTLVTNVLVVDSLGITRCWRLTFRCRNSLARTQECMRPPKDELHGLSAPKLERAIGRILDGPRSRQRYRTFFNNEYYPALIPIHDRMVLLHHVVRALVERGVLDEEDRAILSVTEQLAGSDWFINSEG